MATHSTTAPYRRDSKSRAREDHLDARVRAEYLEMPGLCLTVDQARRLWGLDAADCHAVLHRLVAQGFLTRSTRGMYLRRTAA
jgi:predicted transcriptional regulator of viral defense system